MEEKRGTNAVVRRFILLVVVAMVATIITAVPSFATHQPGHNPGGGGGGTLPEGCTRDGGQVTCVEEGTSTETEERVLSETTELRESPAVAPCQVGQSNRTGIQRGIQTQEVLVTTIGIFEVTYEETTTTVFQGNVGGQIVSGPTTERGEKISEEQVDTRVEEEVVDTTFTPTGPCRNIPGPQNPQAV